MGGGSEGGGVYFVYSQPRGRLVSRVHTSEGAPGHGAVRTRVAQVMVWLEDSCPPTPECVCARRGNLRA